MSKLDETLAALPDVAKTPWEARAKERWRGLIMPRDGFGRLEETVVRLCCLQETLKPRFKNRWCVVMAGDHGVAEEGVSVFPAGSTGKIASALLKGQTAASVLAEKAECGLMLVDMGLKEDLPPDPRLIVKKTGRGTRNIVKEQAMSTAEAEAAVDAGIGIADQLADQGADLILAGSLGVGASTSAAAMIAVFLGVSAENAAGYGSGVEEAVWRKKIRLIEGALQTCGPSPHDPLGVVRRVGGYEIAGLTGLMLGAARRKVPFLADDFSAAAALHVANGLHWKVQDWALIAQVSDESAHLVALDYFAWKHVLQLELRIAECAGALMALPVLDLALAAFSSMATFEEAGWGRG